MYLENVCIRKVGAALERQNITLCKEFNSEVKQIVDEQIVQ